MEEQLMAEHNMILKGIVGSKLYGTFTENSDTDYLACFMPDMDYVIGIKKCEQVEMKTNPSNSKSPNTKTDVDSVNYSLPKLFHILKENNPTALELLFLPENCVVFCAEPWKKVLAHKNIFLSKKAKHTFLGYAFQQKAKVLNKKDRYSQFITAQDLVNSYAAAGLTELPERLELNTDLIKAGQWAAFEKGMPVAAVKDRIDKEVERYGNRIENVRKHGYDGKFLSHVYRLVSEGLQLLVEGGISFPLVEVGVVRAIKEYKIPLDEALKMIEAKEKLVEEAYIRSSLPNTPDLKKVNDLQVRMLFDFWKRQENQSYSTVKELY